MAGDKRCGFCMEGLLATITPISERGKVRSYRIRSAIR